MRDTTPERRQRRDDEAESAESDADRVRPGDPALAVEGLSKSFGSGDGAVTAVDDVSFSVGRGSIVGLLGPNGAGKTTTIKSILGMVVPDAGSVRIEDVDVHADPRAAYERADAMLEGARNDYWRLTVRENLEYFASIGGEDPAAVRDRHDELLDRLDIADKADEPVRNLSRGMKQKVSLASVLARDVSVVFLDEPTLGLDVESSLQLREELGRLVRERDLTVLLSSHDMDVIEAVCDRVLILNDGRIVADDSVESLLSSVELQGFRVAVADLSDATRRWVRDEFEVEEMTTSADRTRFTVSTDPAGFYRLTNRFEAEEVRLEDVRTVAPDLEDVFIDVTNDGGGER
ncbi:ABC transporter ATP-binding protein [Halorussus salinus]|uniref:ABC transporter ATP-binding protein n=1 Tax=Halorussus salinus TaxID=1364935 RepID=UPI001092E0D1|nr:ABC transporter ATP-binding protein [Halorussus salinus]